MNSIKVSIVIPTRNRSRELSRCLEALAEQSFPLEQVEILIADDGSTESLAEPMATGERLMLIWKSGWPAAHWTAPGTGSAGRTR